MAFDQIIEKIKGHFGIMELSDWRDVRPEWIRNIDGAGPATLDHIRMYLAIRGETLKDDMSRVLEEVRQGSKIRPRDE